MQLGADADGALLQRALEGQADDPRVAPLVALVREIEAIEQPGLAPRADFVAGLRQRLLDGPAGDAHTAAVAGGRPGTADSDSDHGPAVVRFGRRARVLVAAVAVLLALAGSLGALSRSALPGDRLYPVKQLLDRVALEVHREPLGLGLTHLAQARDHVADAEQLLARANELRGADRSGPAAESDLDLALNGDLATALDAATDSTRAGHAVLLDAYRSLRQGDALTSLSDYYAQTVPAADALHADPLPGAATAAWQRLHDLLEQNRDATLRELAACTICGDASALARSLLARETSTAAPTGTPTSTPTSSPPGSPTGTARHGATATPTSSSTRSAPKSSDAASDDGSSSPDGSVRLPTVGVTSTGVSVGGGGVELPSPLPTVSLPGAGVNKSGPTVGGAVTLPGATVSAPSLTVPLP
jgi:hypothetical protein